LLTVANPRRILYAKGESGRPAQLRRFFPGGSRGARGDAIVVLSGSANPRVSALGIRRHRRRANPRYRGDRVGSPSGVPFAAIFLRHRLPALHRPGSAPLFGHGPRASSGCTRPGSPARGTVLVVVTIFRPGHRTKRPAGRCSSRRAPISSLLLIIPGVIGGLLWLGIISACFVGPVILAVTSTLLESWISSGLGNEGPAAHRGGHCHSPRPTVPGRGRLGHGRPC